MVFTHIDSELLRVFEELRRREPIFHTLDFGATQTDFENAMTPEYWEVGTSGRRYSRVHPPDFESKASRRCGRSRLPMLGPRSSPPWSRYLSFHLHLTPG